MANKEKIKRLKKSERPTEFLKSLLYSGDVNILLNILVIFMSLAMITSINTWRSEAGIGKNGDGINNGFMNATLTKVLASFGNLEQGIIDIDKNGDIKQPAAYFNKCSLYSFGDKPKTHYNEKKTMCCKQGDVEVERGCSFNDTYLKKFFTELIPYYTIKFYYLFSNMFDRELTTDGKMPLSYPFILPLILSLHKMLGGVYIILISFVAFITSLTLIKLSSSNSEDIPSETTSNNNKGRRGFFTRFIFGEKGDDDMDFIQIIGNVFKNLFINLWSFCMFFLYIAVAFTCSFTVLPLIMTFLISGIPTPPTGYLSLFTGEYGMTFLYNLLNNNPSNPSLYMNIYWKYLKNLFLNPFFLFGFTIYAFLLPWWYNIDLYFGNKSGNFNISNIITKQGITTGSAIGSGIVLIFGIYNLFFKKDKPKLHSYENE